MIRRGGEQDEVRICQDSWLNLGIFSPSAPKKAGSASKPSGPSSWTSLIVTGTLREAAVNVQLRKSGWNPSATEKQRDLIE